MSYPVDSVVSMFYGDERKPRTATSGYVAVLREAYAGAPEVYALPLAHTLRTLASEYERVGNFAVARRHMNAALRTMRSAAAGNHIAPQAEAEIVGMLWSSCLLWVFQQNTARAAKDMAEALTTDAALWDAHGPMWGCWDMQRAKMLNISAGLLWQLQRHDEAHEAHADAMLTALRCTACAPEAATALVESFALTLA